MCLNIGCKILKKKDSDSVAVEIYKVVGIIRNQNIMTIIPIKQVILNIG